MPTYKGMSYTPWSSAEATSAGADRSMLQLKSLGTDTVALNVFWFQDDARSTSISENPLPYGVSQAAARHAIRGIRAHGMDVILKPQVDVRDGSWRGQIKPRLAGRAAWFTSYRGFIGAWAQIAQEEGAVGLSVGTEMNAVQRREAEWREVIRDARARFGGALTYSANWDAYPSVPFWDALDTIGIDAYFPLSATNNPAPAEMHAKWAALADRIGRWRSAAGLSQQVIFSEVGYRSVEGAARAPHQFGPGGAVDLRQQADAYDAMLTVMKRQPWFDGAFFWNWLSDPAAGGPHDTDYTPQNKPAEAVLVAHYGRGRAGAMLALRADAGVEPSPRPALERASPARQTGGERT